MSSAYDADVLVIGSGAGGAVTAWVLAEAGLRVLVLEEGRRHDLADYGAPAHVAMPRLYRRSGMTPILGRVPIGYVEGACLGGSTEINSGFWHRAPRETLARWAAHYDLRDATEASLAPHFQWAEDKLGVELWPGPWPKSTAVFARGVERMGWSYVEVPRAAPGCRSTNACAQGCPTGAKQGMSRRLLPEAERMGARILTSARAQLLVHDGRRVSGVVAELGAEGGPRELRSLSARHVFVCCGPTETPALLLRSGITRNVGNSLRIHPYLKVVARFPEPVDAAQSVLPLIQVKEFAPELALGGSFTSLGQLAMTLAEDWPRRRQLLRDSRCLAQYYVGVRGTGHGLVRPHRLGSDTTELRYDVSPEDERLLGVGLARLASILLAAGAVEVVPAATGEVRLRSEAEAARFLDRPLPAASLGLVTVHAFSSCPSGEQRLRCATDSYGRVHGMDNLWLADASTLPDSPGVNPQGTVMALARRNALAFVRGLK